MRTARSFSIAVIHAIALGSVACFAVEGPSGGGEIANSAGATAAAADAGSEDLDMKASDFECLKNWTKIREFRITNKRGHMDQALAVANSRVGGVYPVGTVIQLVPFEAMVKRAVGFNAATQDWEFFSLDTSAAGTTILARGTTEVVNQFGGNCVSCHSLAAPQWNMTCETGHGCIPLPFTDAQIDAIQNADPRCAPSSTAVPPENLVGASMRPSIATR
jgi:hypothetical protein